MNQTNHNRTRWCILRQFCPFFFYFIVQSVSATTIDHVRIHQSPERTRVVLDLGSSVQHRLFSLDNPMRLVVDMDDAALATDLKKIDLKDTPIANIRSAVRNDNDLRVVFDLSERVKPRSFVLKPIMQYGDRLVVDLYKDGQREESFNKKNLLKRQMRDVIVAIDAGHGGEDPGAIGHGQLLEKDVVFSISSMIDDLFAEEPGYRGLMIREGDYYVELRRRTSIAHDNSADILLSIHADAFDSPKVSGASVYALSDKGATSEAARILAEQENRADLIGGVGGVSLHDKDDLLVEVLLDLVTTASLSASLNMGDSIIGEIGRVNKLHKRNVEQAGFVILKSPEIPSLLIETGYISNPSEARKLASKRHQKKMAQAIFRGARQYMKDNPPPGSLLAWQRDDGGERLTSYVIVRGDTLSEIASRYRVSSDNIKRVNGLRSDKIRIGQVLKIPAS
jgi:N-acetylmuramoyl-L-alanine amidase